MKKNFLILIALFFTAPSFGQIDYKEKINLTLLEDMIVNKINDLRVSSGIDVLSKNDTIKLVSNMECQYLCENGLVENPNSIQYLEHFFGNNVFTSYNSNIVTRWSISNIDDWTDVEKRMADGYMIKYNLDGMQKTLLVDKKEVDTNYKGYLGITCKVQDDILYVSQVIYITK